MTVNRIFCILLAATFLAGGIGAALATTQATAPAASAATQTPALATQAPVSTRTIQTPAPATQATTQAPAPAPAAQAGKQPEIVSVEPAGGWEGTTVTVKGKNFGNDRLKIKLILSLPELIKSSRIASPSSLSQPRREDLQPLIKPLQTTPASLSEPESDGLQLLKFAVPSMEQFELGKYIYRRVNMQVDIDNNGSIPKPFNIVDKNGLLILGGLSLLFVLTLFAPVITAFGWYLMVPVIVLGVFLTGSLWTKQSHQWVFPAALTVVAFILAWCVYRRQNYLEKIYTTLFMEKNTNTYSLSKVQAFAWTIVLIGSYLYYAIGRGFLLGMAEIPDFKTGHLVLIGISYTGLVASGWASASKPKNDRYNDPPRLSDLFSENGSISITRLQHFAFTVVAMVLFLYYTFSPGSEVFANGLPDIPNMLNGLMGISVGGYLGGKLTGGPAVTSILPPRARAGEKLNILGSGFTANTKVLVESAPEAYNTDFSSAASISFDLPGADKLKSPGLKQLIIIPPTQSAFPVDNAFQLIDPKVSAKWVNAKHERIEMTVEGIILNPGEKLVVKIGDKDVEVDPIVKSDNGKTQYTLKPTNAVPAGVTSITVKTADGLELQKDVAIS